MNEKRPAEESEADHKRMRIKLASPSPEKTSGSDTESIHSYQGYKTELAHDTSDTSSSQLPSPGLEYEVVNAEDQKLKFYFSDESGEEEEFDEPKDLFVVNPSDNLDNALLGDTSEENSTSPTSNSDVDPGLPRNDYLDFEKCVLCQTVEKDISYPYCSSCFTWKKKLFPDRPKKRKVSYKKAVRHCEASHGCNKSSDFQDENEDVSLGQNITNGNLSDELDSGVGSAEQNLSEDTVDGPSQPSTSSSHSKTDSNNLNNLCRVCFLRSENGLFVHTNTGHVYGCYKCAKEIWYNNGGCPICRKKVFRVIKVYGI